MLKSIQELLADQRGKPSLDQWNPPLSGVMDLRITADGQWIHEGRAIERHGLVKLFSSILRREEDGEYYLVTPVEKWRIQVEDAPLTITEMEVEGEGDQRQILMISNVDDRWLLDGHRELVGSAQDGEALYLMLPHGLSAKLLRSVYYRLMDLVEIEPDGDSEIAVIRSCGERFVVARL